MLACVDIGTVTCRLALAEVSAGRVVRLDKRSVICNLGEGLAQTGAISPAARERVMSCVRGYLAEARAAGATWACCTLTSAARDASNSEELTGALAALGLAPQVIPGSVEGALTFAGACGWLGPGGVLVADNGGGSTELASGRVSDDGLPELAFVESVDVGCRRVTERFLSAAGPDDAAGLRAAHAFAAELLAPAAGRALAAAEAADATVKALVTCGGTVTSLVAVRDVLVPYDSERVHGATLTAADVAELEGRLAALTVAERAELPGLQPQRAPVIVGGAVAVAELLAATGFDALTVSEHDLLYGLAAAADAALSGRPGVWAPTLAPLKESAPA